MSPQYKKSLGWVLIGLGIGIVAFSPKIVSPGLESLLGIETLVGKQNVVHLPSGGYAYTNPGARVRCVASVAGVGVLVAISGRILVLRAKRPTLP